MIDNILVITGGMGSGKSTVLNLFEKNNFTIINSDLEVLSLFNNSYKRYFEISRDFDNWLGTDFRHQEIIDKKTLRNYLEKIPNGFPISLNIVKPYISERLSDLAKEYSGKKVIFEIPLLFEAQMESNYKNILVVTAPIHIRLERIKLRQSHLSIKQIQQTIDSQLPESCKTEYATFILNNSGSIFELEEKFNNLLPDFLKVYSCTPLKIKL